MNKRGSHVGVVLSFVIFVVFLVFLYTTLQPVIKTQKDKQVIVEGIKEKILSDWQVNLTTVTIEMKKNLSPPGSADCFSLDLDDLGIDTSNKEIMVKDPEEQIVDFEKNGNNLEVEWNGLQGVFYKIYLSEQKFNAGSGTSGACASFVIDDDYRVGSARTEQFIGKEKIGETIIEYRTDKEKLREFLGVPADSDFEFAINSSEMNEPFEEKNIKTNIYTDELPIQYVSTTAEIVPAFVYIRVW